MEGQAIRANHPSRVCATHAHHGDYRMKPAPFVWHASETLDEALALKAEHGEEARFLAGGQSLVPAMNFRIAQPAVLIDLNRLTGLSALTADADGVLRIGSRVRNARLEHDPVAQSHLNRVYFE